MSEPAKADFLSYAREDTAAALRLAVALRAAGVEVWFDQNELVGGDTWDAKIKKQIQSCALFVPIISANTQARAEGYFRLEWLLAAERTRLMGRTKAFLLPVCVDATKEADADVPESFLTVQWTRISAADSLSAFCERVKKLLGAGTVVGVANAGPGAATPAPTNQRDEGVASPAGTRPRGFPKWAALALSIAALAAIAFLALRPAAPPAPTPIAAKPPTDLAADLAAKSAAKSVAVLPFESLSDDKGSEHFSDGICGDLINVLGQVPGLKVAGRTSSFYFKGKQVQVVEIARQLQVAYVVAGTVQKVGDQVRITAQLINGSDGFQLWSSDPITRDLKDIFAVQDEIARLIAQNLKLKLGGPPRVTKTVNPEAYRLVLEGRHFWLLRTPEGF
ncbi:MAG: TIR domain-containing protein [Opitutus sp.]|nr:TIR domain-containing protein [Opitutus sp.]